MVGEKQDFTKILNSLSTADCYHRNEESLSTRPTARLTVNDETSQLPPDVFHVDRLVSSRGKVSN